MAARHGIKVEPKDKQGQIRVFPYGGQQPWEADVTVDTEANDLDPQTGLPVPQVTLRVGGQRQSIASARQWAYGILLACELAEYEEQRLAAGPEAAATLVTVPALAGA